MKQKMTTVWRVQNAHGKGIYQDDASDKLGLESFRAPPHQPAPNRDGLPLFLPRTARFGFESLESCFAWFGRDTLVKAAEYGFGVYCFRVPADRVLKGLHQVIFDKSMARRLTAVPLKEAA